MDARNFREELERQNKQFESAMKQLEELGNVGISIPEETLRAIDEACTFDCMPVAAAHATCPGIRA